MSCLARHYTIQCSVPNTQTRCTLSWTAGGRQAGGGGQARSEEGRRVGRREQGRVGEGGRDGGRERGRKGVGGWRMEEGGGRREEGGSKDMVEEGTRTLGKAGDAAFAVAAPRLWNALPHALKCVVSINILKNNLKTHLFTLEL